MVDKHQFFTRSKIWLEDAQGNVVFGLGRYRILKAIRQQGSLNAAARDLKMGYRAIWARIRATEERLGQPLLVKQTGGAKGGGSTLTPLAEDLIQGFERIRSSIEENTDIQFERDLGTTLTIHPAKGNQPDPAERKTTRKKRKKSKSLS